jgi:pyruvate/2-oxoglutarate dehydrogenase complex dihydrolipoamide dehydrogenase (E3) component
VGGTSLNEGPAPVRTLARAARLMRDTQSWEQFGLRGVAPQVDIAATLANAERVASYAHEHKRVAELIASQGIDLVEGAGPARFVDPHTVRIPDGRAFGGDAVILAVGGHAGRLPIPGAELALTYEDVLGHRRTVSLRQRAGPARGCGGVLCRRLARQRRRPRRRRRGHHHSCGYVKVGKDLRSSLPHILAAGDVNGISMLVPSARHEGRIAAENAVLGTRRQFSHEIVPTGSFTDPEYGSVGLTEAQARERYDCAVAVVRYDDLVRPVVDARPEGFCKLVVERRRRYLLGAHVVGEYSAEVIQMAAACMAANLRVEQVAELQPAFPTFTEAVGMAAVHMVRQLGVAAWAPTWSELRPARVTPDG